MIVLIPGRFQPFHRGHFGNILKMCNKGYLVKVAIRDMSIDKKNPWSAIIIKQVIERTLDIEGIKNVEVFIVPDICENWSSVIKKIVGDFDIVAAGNPRLKIHFDGKKIIHTPRKDNSYSATQVRRQLKRGENIENMCLPSTINIMKDLAMIHSPSIIPVKCSWQQVLNAYVNALNNVYDIDSLNQILVYFVVAFQRHTHSKQSMYVVIRQYIVTCIDTIIPASGHKKFQFIRDIINWAVNMPAHRWQDHLIDDFDAFDRARRDLGIEL